MTMLTLVEVGRAQYYWPSAEVFQFLFLKGTG
jgi:hypothetical protein